MLLNCTIENWLSFRDRTSFSMIGSRERQHGKRVPVVTKYKLKVLPIAAIYGGNASGKTNFFKALNFVKGLVVKGTQPDGYIAVEPFKLDPAAIDKPTSFTFEILMNEDIYEFSFTISKNSIIQEKLIHILPSSEKVLYDRLNNKPNFAKSLLQNQALLFAFKGTRDNQLFLSNSISQKIDIFRPVYDWFKYNLELVAPDTRFDAFEHFIDEGHPLYSTMNVMLSHLDTGITHLGGEDLIFDSLLLPETIKSKIRESLSENETVRLFTPNNERIIITRKHGQLIAKKLVTYHRTLKGDEVKFEMRQESDGSQRIIDLLPAFTEISVKQSQKVYIIDEVDRSLHTLLTRRLLESYLSSCSAKSRSQLLFTTHDVLLMDQDVLRRDEMWVAERDSQGISQLVSFSDYKDVRYDKDIRKSYLQGRLGGIPQLLLDY